jgi:hypothetical protein
MKLAEMFFRVLKEAEARAVMDMDTMTLVMEVPLERSCWYDILLFCIEVSWALGTLGASKSIDTDVASFFTLFANLKHWCISMRDLWSRQVDDDRIKLGRRRQLQTRRRNYSRNLDVLWVRLGTSNELIVRDIQVRQREGWDFLWKSWINCRLWAWAQRSVTAYSA